MANPSNLYEYYQSQGKPLPSVNQRRQTYGLSSDYVGSKEQNVQLLAKLLGSGQFANANRPVVASSRPVNGSMSGGVSGMGSVPTNVAGFVSGMPRTVTDRYGNTIDLQQRLSELSSKYGIPVGILSAQLKQESGFNPNAGSVAGAKGIAQFIDSTAKSYGIDPWNVNQSLEGQARMMADLYKTYGSWERSLSAYNSGNPDRYNDPSFRTHYGSVGETHNYVKNILSMSKNTTQPKEQEITKERKIADIIEKQIKEEDLRSVSPSGELGMK